MFNKFRKFLTIKNDLAYWDYERSYDRNTVIVQANDIFRLNTIVPESLNIW